MKKIVIGVGIIVLAVGGFFLGRQLFFSDSNNSQSQVSSEMMTSFTAFLGLNVIVDQVPDFEQLDSFMYGPGGDTVPNLKSVYTGRFNVDVNGVRAFKSTSNIEIEQDRYHLIIAETSPVDTRNQISQINEFAIGILPGDSIISAVDELATEPILNTPNQYAIFLRQPDGWSAVDILDVQNQFARLEAEAYGFFDQDSQLIAFLIPDQFLGDNPTVTLQSIVRPDDFSTLQNNPSQITGYAAVVESLDSMVLDSSIFVDGFESGDTSRW